MEITPVASRRIHQIVDRLSAASIGAVSGFAVGTGCGFIAEIVSNAPVPPPLRLGEIGAVVVGATLFGLPVEDSGSRG